MRKVLYTIIGIISLFICVNVYATETVKLDRDNYRFGEIIDYIDKDNNIYVLNGYQLDKYDIKTNTRTNVHTFSKDFLNADITINNSTAYLYYTKYSNGKKESTKVLKYDLKNNQEIASITINNLDDVGDNTIGNLVVDSKGYMYFKYDNAAVVSYDPNGNFVDKYDTGFTSNTNYMILTSISYNEDKLYVDFPNTTDLFNGVTSTVRTNGYFNIKNGLFVDKELHMDGVERSLKYSNDGKYALNSSGALFKVIDNKLKSLINISHSRTIEAAGVFKNDYVYMKGNSRTFYRYNLKEEKIDKVYKANPDYSSLYGGNTYVVLNDDIYIFLYDKEYNYYSLKLDTTIPTKKVITSHTSLTHSDTDVKNKYNASLPTYNYKKSIYDVEPNYKNGNYVAGVLKSDVISDTLKQLNFYRWLYGINDVSINEQYMDRSSKGAVILAKLNTLTHNPSKPSDMSDEWYKEAYAGTSAGYDYSGNISYGTYVNNLALDYILDVGNQMAGVGHRFSMLDITSNKTSFGYCGSYSAMSMYTTSTDLGNKDIWYSWPTPGYFPINNIDSDMLWSILLNKGYSTTNDLKITLVYDNNEYIVSSPKVSGREIYFSIPSDLKSKIVYKNNYLVGKKLNVKITGITDSDLNEIEISYPIHFIDGVTGQQVENEKIDISSATIYIPSSLIYSGKPIYPSISVVMDDKYLSNVDDYEVKLENNTEIGSAKVTITGKGNYKGTITKTFKISGYIGDADVEMDKYYTYTGNYIKPEPKVYIGGKQLKIDEDYYLEYSNNKNSGYGYVYIYGKNNYSGAKYVSFMIQTDISNVSLKNQKYTGSDLLPIVQYNGKVLKNKSDYKIVSIKNNKKTGYATVVLEGRNLFTGTVTKYFKIVPAGTKISNLKKGSKKITVNWKKQKTQTTGYQIVIATNSSFTKNVKTINVQNNKTTSKVIKKLKKKTKYYVKIRTFKQAKLNGMKAYVFSSWSKVLTIKTK